MSHNQMSALTWSLIFGGMLGSALGWTLLRSSPNFGWLLLGASVVAVIIGIVLVWWRSRWPDDAA
jgi:membrane protein DedA with SNARE-associated domain